MRVPGKRQQCGAPGGGNPPRRFPVLSDPLCEPGHVPVPQSPHLSPQHLFTTFPVRQSEIMEEKHSGHGKFLKFLFPFEELSSLSSTEGVRGAPGGRLAGVCG